MRPVALLLAAGCVAGIAGCGGTGATTPSLTDGQVERWLAAVQALGEQPSTASTCFLVTRARLPAIVAHPPGTWVVEGFNDQTGDSRRFAGCSVRASGGQGGDGEIGVALTSAVVADPDPATATAPLPGSHWSVTVTSWPGTGRTSTADLDRARDAVAASLTNPPSDPSAYAGPETPFT